MIVFSNNINKTTQFVVEDLMYIEGLSSTYEKIICDAAYCHSQATLQRSFRIEKQTPRALHSKFHAQIQDVSSLVFYHRTIPNCMFTNSYIQLVVILIMFLLIKQF